MTRVVAQINDWTWLRLPLRVGRWTALFGTLLDGMYVSAWPFVGALVLPIVFWLGFRMGWGQGASGVLYIYSLAAMVVLVLVSQHSAAIGLALWSGYVVGDLFYSTPATLSAWTLGAFASHALADLVLALLLIVIPAVARALTRSGVTGLLAIADAAAGRTGGVLPERSARPSGEAVMTRDARFALTAGVHALTEFGLVYLWAQAAGLLLQPFYVWQGIAPMTHGLVIVLRGGGWPLAAVAAYVGAVRIGLESAAATKPEMAARRRVLRESLVRGGGRAHPAYALALVPPRALLPTFAMSGLIDTSWPHAVEVFLAITVVLGMREIGVNYLGMRSRRLSQIPVVVRMLIALVISYALSNLVVRSMTDQTFVPGLISAVLSILVFAVFLPGPMRLVRPRAVETGDRR